MNAISIPRMTELEARLLENLDDDATWTVYGDWLLEQGDVRGTLVQLERTRPKLAKIDQEIADLIATHQARWRDGLPADIAVTGWRHGFITGIAVPWGEDAPARISELVALPALRFARTLRLVEPSKGEDGDDDEDEDFDEDFDEDGPPPIEAKWLAKLALGHLTALELPYLRIGDAGAKALAKSPALARVETLDLRYAAIGDSGVGALAKQLPAVRRLFLQRNAIGSKGVAALGRAKLPHLVELDLRYNPLGVEGAEALAKAPFVGQLRRLDLYRDDITAEGTAVLAKSALPPALRSYWRGL